MLRKSLLCIAVIAAWHPSASAQTASQALQASWVAACAEATPGTAFYDRCQEILNAGPGSAARQSAAALGNNLEIFAAQGRLMMAMARARGRAAVRSTSRAQTSAAGSFNFDLDQAAEAGDSGVFAEGNRWSLIGSVSSIHGDHNDTGFERGYQDDGHTYLLGLDYRWNNRWSGLLALQRESRKVDFQRISGGMDSDSNLWSGGLTYTGDRSFSASLALNSGRLDSTLHREIHYTLTLDAGQPTERRITITSRGESDNSASIRGADLNFGWDKGVSAWTFRYGGELSWQRTNVDRIVEDNPVGLDFLIVKQEVRSLQGSLGFEAARAISVSYGVWQPYARLRWEHEFEDDPRRVFAFFRGGRNVFRLGFETGQPDRNFGELGLGVIGVFPHGWQAYAGWQRTFGNDLFTENRIDVGWRREF
jgi:outer membrane autotransporter protein